MKETLRPGATKTGRLGTHTRFVVDVARRQERLEAKAARRAAARVG